MLSTTIYTALDQCKALNSLLLSIGMHCTLGAAWSIKDKYGSIVVLVDGDRIAWAISESFDKLIAMLGKYTEFCISLHDDKKGEYGCHIDNPYFGCKSLEEMLVKKDLLAVEA